MICRNHAPPVLAFVVLFAGMSVGQEPNEKPTFQEAERLAANYERAVARAIDVCSREDVDDRTKVSWMHLLGRLRSPRACELLVDQIEYCSFWDGGAERHPLTGFPAARALVEIGEPAVPKIIARVARPVSQSELELFAHVLHLVYSPDRTAALVSRLKAAQRQRKGREFKANLSKLIEFCETTDFSLASEWPRMRDWKPRQPDE